MNRCVAAALIVTGFLLVHNAQAQENKRPPEQVNKLAALEGVFEGDATIVQEGKTIKGKVRHNNSLIADDWGFLMNGIIAMEGTTPYKSHNIVGYDPGGNMMHVFTVSNAGETHDHKGTWSKPSALTVRYEGKMEGKPYVEDATLATNGPDAYTLSWTGTLGGKNVSAGEEKLRRMAK